MQAAFSSSQRKSPVESGATRSGIGAHKSPRFDVALLKQQDRFKAGVLGNSGVEYLKGGEFAPPA
jgi:hypothetical protein